MKLTLAVIMIGSLASITIFGFSFMSHSGEYGHQGCFAAIVSGTDCSGTDIFGFLGIHLGAFRDLSSAQFARNISFFLFVLTVLAYAAGSVFFQARKLRYFFEIGRRPAFVLEKQLAIQKIAFIGWLSLHENSPSFL